MTRHPTDNTIAEMIHIIAAERGYDPDILPEVATHLTRKGADDDEREAISAAVHRVWAERFDVALGG